MYSPIRRNTRKQGHNGNIRDFPCFLVLPRIGEYTSLNLFCLVFRRIGEYTSLNLFCLVFRRIGEYIS